MSVTITGDVPFSNAPRVIWDKLAGTIAASTAAALYDAAFADQPQTYTAWKPTAVPATWSVTPDTPAPVDCCAIGCHTLGTTGATVHVEYDAGAGWVTVASATPPDDAALLFLFPAITADAWRVRVTGAVAELGVIMFAVATVFPRAAQFAPATPITEAEEYTYATNRTDGGSWAGRSVTSTGLRFSVEISNLSEVFAESAEWRGFRDHANTGDGAFFIAPKPLAYPREIAYAWSTDTIRAPRAVANKGISRRVDLNLMGYR